MNENSHTQATGHRPNSARPHGRWPQWRILAVDDGPSMLRHVRSILLDAGSIPLLSSNTDQVEHLLEVEAPHLILFDPGLPIASGFNHLRRILDIEDVPVICMSAQDKDEYVVQALEMGADDYIVKPFSPTELVARIGTVLRRKEASGQTGIPEPFVSGDLQIDFEARQVTLAGELVGLTATEYSLLYELSSNAGRVLTQTDLLRRVWGESYASDPQVLRSIVRKLRRKLQDDPNNPAYIFTEPRVGYRMAKPGGERMA